MAGTQPKPAIGKKSGIRLGQAGQTTDRSTHVLRVCAGEKKDRHCPFDSLVKALAASQPGDTIVLTPGIYREAALITTPDITIKGESGAHFQGVAFNGKAALVVRADNVTIEGIECSGIAVRDRNGACVRIEAKDLIIRDVYFHDNQEGVLGGRGGSVVIENSRFERNGYNGGFAHSIYITQVDKFVFRNNHVLSTKDEGQGVKSRAKQTIIEGNVIAGLDARDSRAIDIPNGGDVVIRNNVLQKGANSSNSEMIGLGLEGALHPNGSAIVENNVLLFDKDLPKIVRIIDGMAGIVSRPETAVANRMKGEVVIRNNTVVGAGKLETGEETTKLDNVLHRSRRQAGLPDAPALPDLPPVQQ